jgi:gliding motility-associated-like protein
MHHKRYNFILLFIVVSFFSKVFANQKITFSENKGQWQENILASAKLQDGNLFITNSLLQFIFTNPKNNTHPNNEKLKYPLAFAFSAEPTFENKTANFIAEKLFPSEDYENYFLGKDRSKWKSNVRKFSKLILRDYSFPVRIEIEGKKNSIKSSYFLKAKTNHKNFSINYSKELKLKIKQNVLILETPFNEIQELNAIAFQHINGEKKIIECKFVLKENNCVSFDFPNGYDSNYELEIDPTLVFSSYSGSVADNFGMTATYDNQGNAYSAGTVFGFQFPTTNGAYDQTASSTIAYGSPDIGILKYRPNGQNLVYCTFLGGDFAESIHSMVANNDGELFVFGATGSSNFPIISDNYQTNFSGGPELNLSSISCLFPSGTDGYISKFSPNGTNLMASTFFGGNNSDAVNNSIGTLLRNYGDEFRGEINLDESDNVYVYTTTNSSNINTTPNAIQSSLQGSQDALLLKLNNNLTQLLYCTYLGGGLEDCGNAIYVQSNNKICIGGGTNSTNFPVTNNTFQQSFQGGLCDGYIGYLDLENSSNNHISFFGTTEFDQVYFVQQDFYGRIYGYGQTEGNMPVVNSVFAIPNSGQFICCFNADLSSLRFNSLIGNGAGINISPGAFLVDNCNRIFISGWGGNLIPNSLMINMPLTNDAIKDSTDGNDFYLAVLDTGATSLLYGSYFGGILGRDHVDGGTSRFDKKGIVYQAVCAGCGTSNDFPTTPNAYSTSDLGPNCNNGIFKLDFEVQAVTANISVSDTSGCAPFAFNANNLSQQYGKFKWILPNGDVDTLNNNVSFVLSTPGTYQIKLIAFSNLVCNISEKDSIIKTIVVHENPIANFTFLKNECFGSAEFTNLSSISDNSTLSYSWNFGDNQISEEENPNHTFANFGSYNVSLTVESVNGCIKTFSSAIDIAPFSNFIISNDTTLCYPNKTITLGASGGLFYKWSPSEFLDNSAVQNPLATLDSTTLFSVEIFSIAQTGDTCVKTLSTKVKVSNFNSSAISLNAEPDSVFEGNSALLTSNFQGSSNFWEPANLVSPSSGTSTNAKPLSSTLFRYTTTDSLGCVASDTIRVFLITKGCPEPLVFIPNTFSPNSDGKNDYFLPRGELLVKYSLQIFDRWGKEVYTGTEMSIGWNGKNKDQFVEPGVYGYVIMGTCASGDEYYKQGNVTLLR